MQRADPSLGFIAVAQRLGVWLVWYGIGLTGLFVALLGSIAFAALLIVVGELLLLQARPQPRMGPASYAAPMPAGWQGPIAALRWLVVVSAFWTIVGSAISITVAFAVTAGVGFLVFLFWPHVFGVGNIAVLVLLTAWLSTRPLWIDPLRKVLKRDYNASFASYLSTIGVTADSVEIEVRFIVIGTPPQPRWHLSVPFADLEEVRLLDGLSAEGYLTSLQAYDPTLQFRLQWEVWRFYMGKVAKPSLFMPGVTAAGAQLLLRGPGLLYLISNADETGPAAVAAWEAWRATHATQVATSV